MESDVVRLSLRTKDRVTALRSGLKALVVFEELLRMEPAFTAGAVHHRSQPPNAGTKQLSQT